MNKILDGKKTSLKIKEEIYEITSKLSKDDLPVLGIIQIGDLEESNIYIKHKMNMAKELNIDSILVKLTDNPTDEKIFETIKELSNQVTGIIVQLPMVSQNVSSVQNILNSIEELQDIDGLRIIDNQFNPLFLPATPKGIILLLNEYKIDFSNYDVSVVGQSNIVGKPLSFYFDTHSKISRRYDKLTPKDNLKFSDLVIVATGVKNSVTVDMLKDDVILMDVGIHRENSKISGDLDFDACIEKAKYITPVPGGVGPMTVISLIINLIKSYCLQNPDKLNLYKKINKYF
ncbi:methylenetetrahydrofolate dehydrogenase/methenyltetrahydrofolate cyclohydrolase [Metamycoplasma cloacale]|uniref:Bifunctional protein FolD n=1 Tax=Metamycoplasma cloacale TaxID=92401 RepID=A0A2Z4LM56_9BACT|nr:bifunctional 5,10-methylenetetrahydrofolate dehydrogenase/5,10-methenyltetrahydrofolate cyclohydrolase [Metamycoplasma cloacale]AWX42816.1 bifunctional 5,10-methylenetetrahydrofolate dehydrogenase/5,10-methenyltetrahydrofolate cyclohydrolase [Metamycoplasma cloacale]VEU79365.1 methylenetetrahydrofolate dehydrogenase/methenyltetrahydrofolate cyclohydrolase [Metamycoplasma cloacale]